MREVNILLIIINFVQFAIVQIYIANTMELCLLFAIRLWNFFHYRGLNPYMTNSLTVMIVLTSPQLTCYKYFIIFLRLMYLSCCTKYIL